MGRPDTLIFCPRVLEPHLPRKGLRRVVDSISHNLYLDAFLVLKAVCENGVIDEHAILRLEALLYKILVGDHAEAFRLTELLREAASTYLDEDDFDEHGNLKDEEAPETDSAGTESSDDDLHEAATPAESLRGADNVCAGVSKLYLTNSRRFSTGEHEA